MKENCLSNYFANIQIDENYVEINIYDRLQSIYGKLSWYGFMDESNTPLDIINTKYATFLQDSLGFLELAKGIFDSAKVKQNKHKTFLKFTGYFSSFVNEFKTFVDSKPQFRLGLVFEVFNVLEYVGVISLFITKNKCTYLSLYEKGCAHLNVGIKRFFSFAKSTVSTLSTAIGHKYCSSVCKDFSHLFKMANFYQAHQHPLPSSIDRGLLRKMALFANGGYMNNTTEVISYLSENNIRGIYSPCNLGFTTGGSFNFLSVYGHLLEDDNKSVFLTFGGTYIKTLNLKTFATIITDFVQLKYISCAYIVSLGLVSEVIENFHDKQNKEVFVCGHSLGGGYTQFAAAYFKNVEGYTFNSAGLSRESVRLLNTSNCTNLTHIRMSEDVVSCVGTLIEGKIYYLHSKKSYWHILDNHSMETIIKSL